MTDLCGPQLLNFTGTPKNDLNLAHNTNPHSIELTYAMNHERQWIVVLMYQIISPLEIVSSRLEYIALSFRLDVIIPLIWISLSGVRWKIYSSGINDPAF